MNEESLRDVTPYCRLSIDVHGAWFYEENEIINPLVLKSFQEALEITPEGGYRITMHGECCAVEVEDTPFVISTLRGDVDTGFTMFTNAGGEFPLDPKQLRLEGDNMLYTQLPSGMPARFTRPAYYALALAMEENDTGDIVLTVQGQTHTIYARRP